MSNQSYDASKVKKFCLDCCDGPLDPFVIISRGLDLGARLKVNPDALSHGIERSLQALGVAVNEAGMQAIKKASQEVSQGNVHYLAADNLFEELQSLGVNVEDEQAYFEPGT
jgi:cell division protein ZapA (FtsZ GTPase activity inhibitor)